MEEIKEHKEDGSSWLERFLLILTVVVLIIIFVATLGQIDIPLEKGKRDSDEETDTLSKLQTRHKKLKAIIQRKEALNIKLNKKFKFYYFCVRFGLASLYVGCNVLLYFVFNITKLGDILNWNQLVIIVITLFSFLTFGTFTNVKEYIQTIKMRLEIKTYKKYLNITDQLETHKGEQSTLIASISKVQLSISNKVELQDFVSEDSIDGIA